MKSKKGLIFKVSIVFLVIIIGYLVIDYFKENVESDIKADESQAMVYNSPRYFFRVKKPEKWEVEAGVNNFMLDSERNLVLALHPLVDNPNKTTTDPEEGEEMEEPMIRDKTAKVSIYYFPIEEGSEFELKDAMNISIDRLLDSERNVGTDQLDSITPYRTDHLEFSSISFNYIKDLIPYRGEMYVVTRSIAYYVICIEGENDLIVGSTYVKYRDAFKEIVDEFKLSVFEDYKDVAKES